MEFLPGKTPSLSAAILLSLAIPYSATALVPTDNPVATFYAADTHLSDYAWTDELAWADVYNIVDYGGVADGNGVGDGVGVTDNLNAFHAAVQAAYEAGGGVVYIPAGTYYFSDHLYLKSGVVVRGATPVQQHAQADDFAPPTRLEFPKYFFDKTLNGGAGYSNDLAFKFIFVEDNSIASHLGLVWLDINRAGIALSSDGEGTHNRLVFGTRTNNVAAAAPDVPDLKRTVDDVELDFQHAWQRFSWRFVRNISVYGIENILIANNRCNDIHYTVDLQLPGWESLETDDFLQAGYVIQDTKRVFGNDNKAFVALDGTHLPYFKYTNHYGIAARGSSGSVWGAAPFETPGLFRPNVTVRDNWVYTTMRVGYHLSGWGLKVLDNIKKDLPNKVWWLHPTGLYSLSGAQTLENRGLDVGGSQILIDGNDLAVERHRINNGGYFSTDGEGILVQECCGGTTLDDITITNNTVNAYIGIYKMPYTRNIEIDGNTLEANYTGPANIMVNANKNGSQAPAFGVTINNNTFTASGSIRVDAGSGGNEIHVTNNTMSGGTIRYPEGITTLGGNSGYGSLDPYTTGGVRDYPLLELDDPSTNGLLASGPTTLRARVTGSLLEPSPAGEADLPDITGVEIYANAVPIASFDTNPGDPGQTAWLYEASWDPAPGYYQLSAKATPAGYTGPIGSTEWFTVSDVVSLYVSDGPTDGKYLDWRTAFFPGEADPSIIGDEADGDRDGIPLLLEFIFGGDPTIPDTHIAPSTVQGASTLNVSVRIRTDLGPEVLFDLLQSTDLASWAALDPAHLTGVSSAGLPSGIRAYHYEIPSTPTSPVFVKMQAVRKP